MVQTVSLADTKDVQLTKQPTKQTTNISSNIDFLELLMKDIKDTEIQGKEEKQDNLKQDLGDNKEEKTVLLDDLLNNDKDLKTFIKTDDLNIKIPINLTKDFKDETIKEIKNILSSKIKQDNILLSKTDIKEFKKIDNLKDLIKFADKKGLNIGTVKIETEKVINKIENNEITKPIEKNVIHKINSTSTENIILMKQNKKIDNKLEIKSELNIETKVEQKVEIKEDNKISLETILKKSNIKKNEVNEKNNSNIENIKTNLDNKPTKIEHKTINLDSLLNPNKAKQNVEDKIIKPEIKVENNQINLNNSQPLVNEIKAKSIQAKETIKHFNQNLDEAIKNYKPPVSKINIELNPQNLGKVEVSIIKRGNNIQVHLNTDQNNIAMFQTNQAEFRQALSNIGFTNIDMSFNSNQSNQDKDRKQNQAKKSYQDNEQIEEVGDIEIQATYKYA